MTTHQSASRPTGVGISVGPLAVGALGAMVTVAALIALIVAGLAAADLFPLASTDAQALTDRGVWASTRAWANPLGIVGLAVLFAGAVPYALHNIRTTITYRRDAMTHALPIVLSKGTDS